jgi:hypothetical protein
LKKGSFQSLGEEGISLLEFLYRSKEKSNRGYKGKVVSSENVPSGYVEPLNGNQKYSDYFLLNFLYYFICIRLLPTISMSSKRKSESHFDQGIFKYETVLFIAFLYYFE